MLKGVWQLFEFLFYFYNETCYSRDIFLAAMVAKDYAIDY